MKAAMSFVIGWLATTMVVQAGELMPSQAASVKLGEISGIAFYTPEADGFRVVTTLALGEMGPPVRFTTVLQASQRAVVSVPGALGDAAAEVEIARLGDKVYVTSGPMMTSSIIRVSEPVTK